MVLQRSTLFYAKCSDLWKFWRGHACSFLSYERVHPDVMEVALHPTRLMENVAVLLISYIIRRSVTV